MRNDEYAYGFINLLGLIDSLIVEFEGEDGIFIPFRSNPSIYVGARNINLQVRISPMRQGADNQGNTHMAYATARKDVLDAMSEEDKKILLPYLGKFHPRRADEGDDKIISGKPVARRIVKAVPPDTPKEDDKYKDFDFQ